MARYTQTCIHPWPFEVRVGWLWLSRHSVETYPETSLHIILSGNIRPQLSQFAEPLWTDPGIKSGFSVHKLISALKKNTKWGKQGMNGQMYSRNARKQGKSHQWKEVHSGDRMGIEKAMCPSDVLFHFRFWKVQEWAEEHSEQVGTNGWRRADKWGRIWDDIVAYGRELMFSCCFFTYQKPVQVSWEWLTWVCFDDLKWVLQNDIESFELVCQWAGQDVIPGMRQRFWLLQLWGCV